MKTTNVAPSGLVADSIVRGHTGRRAGSSGITVTAHDGTQVIGVTNLHVPWVQDLDDDEAEIASEVSSGFTNDTGAYLGPGTVVVIVGDTVVTTTTPQDTRTVGVVVLGGDDGETVIVQTSGVVPQVIVTAAVTADNYAETSTTAGAATENATPRAGSFGKYLTAGTTPRVLLFGQPYLTGVAADASETPFDHGSMGATETIDLADGSWHRGTLSADCAITVQGFTVDEGVVAIFEVTGTDAITWDADVDFGGADDQPNASGYTIFVLISSVGDSDIKASKWGAAATATTGSSLLTVDPGTPTYDTSGADVVVTVTSKWGVDGDGPYYDSAGVTAGEEAILALDPDIGDYTVVPYVP